MYSMIISSEKSQAALEWIWTGWRREQWLHGFPDAWTCVGEQQPSVELWSLFCGPRQQRSSCSVTPDTCRLCIWPLPIIKGKQEKSLFFDYEFFLELQPSAEL
jgi:hypothetical protein